MRSRKKWLKEMLLGIDMKKYTKHQILAAAKLGEVSLIDANHIISLLDEAVEKEQSGFKRLDKVIYDSGFGYDVGIFMGEGTVPDTFLIEMQGKTNSSRHYNKRYIYRYTMELELELSGEYGEKAE